MFDKRKTSLFGSSSNKKTSVDAFKSKSTFVNAALGKKHETKSGNGSLKYTTTGNAFVDQFSTVSQYKAPRPYSEIAKDMETLWNLNPLLTVCFTFYIRMVTRKVQFFNGDTTEKAQKGAGLKNEGIYRMMWIGINHSDVFWKNIHLFVAAGGWKDIFEMMSEDLQFHGYNDKVLDWDKLSNLILTGLENPNTSELIKKYLPQIKARSKAKTVRDQARTLIAKHLASKLFGGKVEGNHSGYAKYRRLKSSGTAHIWQKLISKKLMNRINFDTIHGRALMKLVSSKFLRNQGLQEKYSAWIGDPDKKTAKFTGFVYELAMTINKRMEQHKKDTTNKQYLTMLNKAKVNLTNSPYKAIGVMDASGSMSSYMYIGNGKIDRNMRSIDVAFANTIFLDDMMPDNSLFKGFFLEFSNTCNMHELKGDTFVDKWNNSSRGGFGGTNFMSVFNLFARIKRENPHTPESEFPNMIVAFSDGEFNNVGGQVSNVTRGRQILRQAGFSNEFADNFGFCFVDLPNTFYSGFKNRKPKFETFGNVKNVFYFSGYDLAPLGFLFGNDKVSKKGVPTTAAELFDAAMDQEIMEYIKL